MKEEEENLSLGKETVKGKFRTDYWPKRKEGRKTEVGMHTAEDISKEFHSPLKYSRKSFLFLKPSYTDTAKTSFLLSETPDCQSKN